MAKDKLTLVPSSIVNNGVDTNQKPPITMISTWKQELHQEISSLGAIIDTDGMLGITSQTMKINWSIDITNNFVISRWIVARKKWYHQRLKLINYAINFDHSD